MPSSSPKNKRALVTGAAGFVGFHLTKRLVELGWSTVGIDSLTDYYHVELKRQNIADLRAAGVGELIEEDLESADLAALLSDVDVVFHLAAQPGVRPSWGSGFDAYVHRNVTVTQRLLEAARGAQLEKFVLASSSSVYGDAETLPTVEGARLAPVSPYGATKVLAENLAYAYWRNFEVPTVRLRYFTVYGPKQRPDMAFNRILSAGLEGAPITIFGDGEQTRDFTFVADAAEATVATAIGGTEGAVYNIGGGARVSMNEVLREIEQVVGETLTIERTDSAPGEARHTAADTSLAREEIGFQPAWTLPDGLRAQAAWHRGKSALTSLA